MLPIRTPVSTDLCFFVSTKWLLNTKKHLKVMMSRPRRLLIQVVKNARDWILNNGVKHNNWLLCLRKVSMVAKTRKRHLDSIQHWSYKYNNLGPPDCPRMFEIFVSRSSVSENSWTLQLHKNITGIMFLNMNSVIGLKYIPHLTQTPSKTVSGQKSW